MDALTKWSATAVARARPPLSLKRFALIGLGCALTLAASGYGTYWWAVDRFFQSTDDSYVGGDVTPISPHIAGFVAEILVSDNERIHAGQLLVRLDDRDVRAAADHAQAVLEQRSATLASLRAKYELQQSTIRQASADLDAKSAQADFAKVDADRYRTLALSNYGSRQDAERTSALDTQARAGVSAAQAALAAARQQLGVLKADIAEATAAVAQARADLETAQLNLGYAEIRSPIDGYCAMRRNHQCQDQFPFCRDRVQSHAGERGDDAIPGRDATALWIVSRKSSGHG